jgi:hypothetical protein
MVLAAPGPLLTPPPSSSLPKTPHRSSAPMLMRGNTPTTRNPPHRSRPIGSQVAYHCWASRAGLCVRRPGDAHALWQRVVGVLGRCPSPVVCRRSTAVPLGPPRPSSITHPEEDCTGDCDLQLHWLEPLAGAIWYTTRRRRSVPRGEHMGRVEFDSRIFSPWNGRSPVSHPTCEVPFPQRRSGEYRKRMIPAVVPGGLGISLGSRTLERAGL